MKLIKSLLFIVFFILCSFNVNASNDPIQDIKFKNIKISKVKTSFRIRSMTDISEYYKAKSYEILTGKSRIKRVIC